MKQNFIGWMDWNLALNMNGGPTYIHNNYDSPIIINATANVFYKQPMFYAMGHYSKFIRPGSVRLNTTIEKYHRDHISAMGFLRPDGIKAIVIVNTYGIWKNIYQFYKLIKLFSGKRKMLL